MIKKAHLCIGVEKKTLLQAIDFHNEKFALKVTKQKRSPDTLKKWITTRGKLEAFIKAEFKLPDIPLHRIEYAFAEDFFDFLTLTQDMEDNTARKYLKNTKQILKMAVQRKWLTRNPLEDYVCSYIDPERDILNIDELSILYHKTIDIPRLQEAKDCYLLMALTGYAYKDALLLEPYNIVKYYDGDDWIVKNREDLVPRKCSFASNCKGGAGKI